MVETTNWTREVWGEFGGEKVFPLPDFREEFGPENVRARQPETGKRYLGKGKSTDRLFGQSAT